MLIIYRVGLLKAARQNQQMRYDVVMTRYLHLQPVLLNVPPVLHDYFFVAAKHETLL